MSKESKEHLFKKGNTYYKNRKRHGRKYKFATPKDLMDAALNYFEWVDNNPIIEHRVFCSQGQIVDAEVRKMRPYTLGGLCLHIGVHSQYICQAKAKLKTKENEELRDVIDEIETAISTQKYEGAVCGLFNPTIVARDLGLTNKEEIQHSGEVNIPPITWVSNKE